MRIKVENDLFDIASRLREIKPTYGVVFNTETQQFEVTDSGKTVLRLPFENLDERTIRHVRYTSYENIDCVIADIDKSNEELAKRKVKEAQDDLENKFSRAMRLCGA